MKSTPRRFAVLATALLITGTLSGCFGHDDDQRSGAGGSTTATPTRSGRGTAALEVHSVVTRVAGELPPVARKRLAARAGALVKSYLRSAFLEPRTGRASARAVFPGFTREARALADHDRAVLTGAGYAGADEVEPRSGTAYVNVVAPNGHAVGATVHVDLALRVTEGDRSRPVQVGGRLMLTPTPDGWRIFGYDLNQSGEHARSSR